MGLDMYLFKVKLFDDYSFQEIAKMKEDIEFVERYKDALETSRDFENRYDERDYWNHFDETKEEKKERIRKALNEFINESQMKYLELKDKYEPALIKKLQEFSYDEVGYWRKANQIHSWFVENVQSGVDDCGYYVVSKSQLEKLKGVSQLVLNNIEHADTLLPTQPGFFFGSTDYDDYYKEDLKETLETLTKVLNETDFEKETILYASSW